MKDPQNININQHSTHTEVLEDEVVLGFDESNFFSVALTRRM